MFRGLNRERDELQSQVTALNDRLDALKREATESRDGLDERAWEARRTQSLEVLRDALTELRNDGTAA
jgi:predicted  nucleic acid-binding Zn-ribbon protein